MTLLPILRKVKLHCWNAWLVTLRLKFLKKGNKRTTHFRFGMEENLLRDLLDPVAELTNSYISTTAVSTKNPDALAVMVKNLEIWSSTTLLIIRI